MIDNKGRLFGKINIVDLLIVLIVIAAVAFVGFKVAGPSGGLGPGQKVAVTYYCDECPDFAVEALKEGAPILDKDENNEVGIVTSWESEPMLESITDGRQSVVAERPGYCFLTLHSEAEGNLNEHGVVINGVQYGIGHTLTIYAGTSKLYLKVRDIQPLD